jgi:hypothetical protein
VRYLYWGGGALVQPTMLRTRPDKEPADCLLSQIPSYSKAVR